ncbi:MAG: hypothetical protein K0U12_06305 [Gammaproteobacteria bacterium]|nr:hypothetical protein [Gammaproteobacteria bacterium]
MSYFIYHSANVIGIVGVVLVLLAYCLLQLGRMSQFSVSYSLINLIGSVLLLISLFVHWNLASVVIEIAWLIISIYGLVKSLHGRRRMKKNS